MTYFSGPSTSKVSHHKPGARRFALKVLISTCIGVGRFRILGGGQGLEYLGAKGGGQIPSRHITS